MLCVSLVLWAIGFVCNRLLKQRLKRLEKPLPLTVNHAVDNPAVLGGIIIENAIPEDVQLDEKQAEEEEVLPDLDAGDKGGSRILRLLLPWRGSVHPAKHTVHPVGHTSE